jgi:hypothetical protein
MHMISVCFQWSLYMDSKKYDTSISHICPFASLGVYLSFSSLGVFVCLYI